MTRKRANDERDQALPPQDFRWIVLRAVCAVGLGASLLLLYEYMQPAPSFCAEGSGCDAVRASEYAKLLGVSTPVYGVLGFGTLVVLSFLRTQAARRLLLGGAAAGALASAVFIYLQARVFHAFCVYCLITDIAGLVVF